jgi:hypothetical protein
VPLLKRQVSACTLEFLNEGETVSEAEGKKKNHVVLRLTFAVSGGKLLLTLNSSSICLLIPVPPENTMPNSVKLSSSPNILPTCPKDITRDENNSSNRRNIGLARSRARFLYHKTVPLLMPYDGK